MYYFKINNKKTLINMTAISGFSYQDPTSSSVTTAQYKGSIASAGAAATTTYTTTGSKTVYAHTINTKAMTRLGFVISPKTAGSPISSMYIYRLGFASAVTGTVRIQIWSYSNGAGSSGTTTLICDKSNSISNSSTAWAGQGMPDVGNIMSAEGGYSGSRYKITITFTPTTGSATVVNIPCIYATYISGSEYRYSVLGPVDANGITIIASGKTVTTNPGTAVQYTNYTPDTLNLENGTFKALSYND